MPRARKQTQIKQAARHLFIRHGIRRVSVEEICKAAQVSKATFYKAYANKSALAVELVDEILNELFARTEALMQADQPFAERMTRMMTMELEASKELGASLLQELYTTEDPGLQALMQRAMAEGYQMALDFLAQGQRAGVLNPDFSPELFLYLMELGDKMYRDPRLLELEPDLLRRTRLMQDFMMYGLCTPPDHPLRSALTPNRPQREAK